jgi:imidazolonepropionase
MSSRSPTRHAGEVMSRAVSPDLPHVISQHPAHPRHEAGELLDAGVTVAPATDCNPGTCFSSSMPLMIAPAVRQMRMTPDEALWAATAGAARALRRSDIGVIAPGMRADLTVLDAPSHLYLAYRPGVPIARALECSGT